MNKIKAIEATLNLHLYYVSEIKYGANTLVIAENTNKIISEAFPKFL